MNQACDLFFLLPWVLLAAWSATVLFFCARGQLEQQCLWAFPAGAAFVFLRVLLRKFMPAHTDLGKFGLFGTEIPLLLLFVLAQLVCTICDILSMTVVQLATVWLLIPFFVVAALGVGPVSLFDSLLGAGVGFLIPYLIARVYRFFSGRSGLGTGDMQMFASVGAFVGPSACLWVVNISSILCLLSVTFIEMVSHKTIFRERPVPFAPYIAVAALAMTLL